MNKTIKSFVAFALVSTMAGTALFAAPKKNHKAPKERPGVEREERPVFEEVTLVGKVRQTKWGYYTFETDEGDRYVISTTGNPDLYTMRDVRAKEGSRMVYTGLLNHETKIFTVTHNGFKNQRPSAADAK